MEDLEEFAESPAPPDLFDVPYSIVRYLSAEGDRFVSQDPLSFWICGYTNEVECFFPIVLRERGDAESRKVKRNRREETALEPKYIETGGLKGCVHVNLGDKIYNLGGSACPNTRPRAAEDCIKVIDIYDTSKVVDGECRMNKARYGPQVAVVGKKIYIFGGDDAEFRDGKSLKSAEFFDVDQRRSHPLPDGFESDFRLVGVYNNHKIMFLPGKGRWSDTNSGGYLTTYYCYDTLENVWLTETETKLNFMSKGIGYFNRVLVGTTLYWVSEHGFNCYDFKTRELGGNRFQDNFDISFHGNFNFDSEVSMFHMDKNVFCVIIGSYEKIFWMAVSISMSNTVIPRFGFYKLDVKVLHVDLYTIPDGSLCREVPALLV